MPVSNPRSGAVAPESAAAAADPLVRSDVTWEPWNIGRAERERRHRHPAAVIWFTGLSGSGKSTLARALERHLFDAGHHTMLLDGDQLRHGLCAGLGFSPDARAENIRRAGHAARLFFEHGNLVLCAFVSPFRRDRERVRELIGADAFLEIFVACELDECRRRDPKGLYAAAARGAISNFTGVQQAYEPPPAPALVADSQRYSPPELVGQMVDLLRRRGVLP